MKEYYKNDIVRYHESECTVIRKLTEEEKQERAFMANPDAGDYYEIVRNSDGWKDIVWSARLTPVFCYQVVSMAVILRDFVEVKYINEEHKKLVDIADTFYNANLGPDCLMKEYKIIYDAYGKEFFDKVLEDASAIDSQVDTGNVDQLILDYLDLYNGAISPCKKAEKK